MTQRFKLRLFAMKTPIVFIAAFAIQLIAANEQYVVFTEQDTSNDPPSRALAASVLQHSLAVSYTHLTLPTTPYV